MGLETVTDIDDLNPLWPLGSDAASTSDNHLRNIKTALKNDFPNITGAMTATQAELNYSVGVTSAIQTQFSAKAPLASPAFTGVPTGPTAASGSSGTQLATLDYANALAFNTVLPAQPGTAVRYNLQTLSGVTSWGLPKRARTTRTNNTILVAVDSGGVFDITSGTFSQTFTAAATLGDGWHCWLKNSGSGEVTLDPNGLETIDSLTSFIMYPGECRFVQCDGSGFNTYVISAFAFIYTASATFTMPPGYKAIGTRPMGGGGSGGSGGRTSSTDGDGGTAGGGGAAPPEKILYGLTAGTGYTVTVAAATTGGAAQTVNTTAGNVGVAGGTSSFGTLALAYGGGRGAGGPIASAGTAGGAGGGSAGAGGNGAVGGAVGGLPSLNGTSGRGSTSQSFQSNVGTGGGGTESTAWNPGPAEWGGGAGGGINASGTASNIGGAGSIYGGTGGGAGGGQGSSDGGAGGLIGAYALAGGAAGATSAVAGTNGTAGTNGGAGGGGGSLNGFASGAGGAGARGEVQMRGIA